MHAAAREYVARQVESFGPFRNVVEIGSRNINGEVRDLFGHPDLYVGLDLAPGPGVDVVGHASDYKPAAPVEAVVCCEVFEHAPDWRALISTAFGWLEDHGVLIVTCAGPGRRPHSAIDGGWSLHPGEHYANIAAPDLADAFRRYGFAGVSTDTLGTDTRGVAVKAAGL